MTKSLVERVREALPESRNYARERLVREFNEPVAVASDFHIPHTSEERLVELMTASERQRARTLLIVGDFFTMDAFAFWEPGIDREDRHFSTELEAASNVLGLLYEQFDDIYLTPGNHDKRLMRKIGSELGMAEIARMVWPIGGWYPGGVGEWRQDGREKSLTVSDLPSMKATINGERWYFTHPKNNSIIPGRVAQRMAGKMHCHVAIGHVHSFALTTDTSGRYWALDLGGMFDADKFAYIHEQDSYYPAMVGGFYVISDGRPIAYPGKRPAPRKAW